MDLLIGSQNGQLQSIKFESFSLNTSITTAPTINLSLLPVNQETTSGSAEYPPILLTAAASKHLWIVRENGAVEAYSLSDNILTDIVVFPFDQSKKIVAIFSDASTDSILAVSSTGDLASWSVTSPEPSLRSLKSFTAITAAAKYDNILAVGGKGAGNNLQLFNLETLTSVYKAKPAMNTRLNTPIPVDIRAISFTQSNPDCVAIANADGQIFLHDFKLKCTPVLERQVLPKKSTIVSMVRAHRDDLVLYTDTKGIVECYDLRAGRSYGRFGPHEGAITGFELSSDILFTISKDRFLRIFNYNTRVLLHKCYLKHFPSSLHITSQSWLQVHAKQYEDSEDEEVWEEMATVSDKKKKVKTEDLE